MQDLPAHSLLVLVDGIDCVRLTNVAWIRQAETHNKKSPSLQGARERTPILEGTVFWLGKLAALSEAAGGDDARVLALLDRALAKIETEAAAA